MTTLDLSDIRRRKKIKEICQKYGVNLKDTDQELTGDESELDDIIKFKDLYDGLASVINTNFKNGLTEHDLSTLAMVLAQLVVAVGQSSEGLATAKDFHGRVILAINKVYDLSLEDSHE